jgi:hypothetical protein
MASVAKKYLVGLQRSVDPVHLWKEWESTTRGLPPMNIKKFIFAAAALTFATATLAEEVGKTSIQISIDEGDGSEEIHLNLDSDSMGFNMHDMQVGEMQSIVDDNGRPIMITREEDGFKLDIDGKTVELPLLGAGHEMVWMEDIDVDDVEIDVHVIAGGTISGDGKPAGVMIISQKSIDDATQESIRALLESTGHDAGVEFIEGGKMDGGPHKAIIIKKEFVTTR